MVVLRRLDPVRQYGITDYQQQKKINDLVDIALIDVWAAWQGFADDRTKHWNEENRPLFDFEIHRSGGGDVILTLSEGSQRDDGFQVWHALDYGTPPHRIEGSNVDRMRFLVHAPIPGVSNYPPTYQSSSVAGDLRVNRPPVYLGNYIGSFAAVNHPGIEPRSYTEILLDRIYSRWYNRVTDLVHENTPYYYGNTRRDNDYLGSSYDAFYDTILYG